MLKHEAKTASLLRKYSLTEFQGLVIPALIPAVSIDIGKPYARAPQLGVSRFGGDPDLPAGSPWPSSGSGRPLSFLGQLNLGDLPQAHLAEGMLPSSGLLQFWWDELLLWEKGNCKRSPWGSDPVLLGRVIYVPDDKAIASAPYPTLPDNLVSKSNQSRHYSAPNFHPCTPHRLKLKPVWSMERSALYSLFNQCDAIASDDDGDDAWTRALNFYNDLHSDSRTGDQETHRLLGSLYEVGSDCQETAQMIYARLPGVKVVGERWPNGDLKPTSRQKADWILLAQFASDDRMKNSPKAHFGWMFGDAGELTFWIRKQDLRSRKFDKAVALINSA